MNLTKIANWISFYLSHNFWMPVIFILLITRTGLSTSQILILVPAILFIHFIFEVLVMRRYFKKSFFEIWDIQKRQERYKYLFIYILATLISLIFIYIFGTTTLFKYAAELFFLMVVLSLITLEWKISLHMAINTAGAILLNIFFNWSLPWIFICILLVFWSRIYLKRHTVAQLIGGFLVSLVVMVGSLYLFP